MMNYPWQSAPPPMERANVEDISKLFEEGGDVE